VIRAIVVLSITVLAAPALADTKIENYLSLKPGGRLVVDTDAGSVTVTGESGSGGSVVITSSRSDLESLMEIDVRDDGGEARVTAERRSKMRIWKTSGLGKLHFEIRVPYETELEIDTAGGAIEVDSIRGRASLDTSGGPITVTDLEGDLEADTSGGPITISGVGGDVEADTSGGGIEIEQVQGDVSADTSGGAIRIRDVTGDVSADTSGGSIRIIDAGGRVEADTSGGGIEVRFMPGNAEGGSLSASGGGIRITLDSSVGLEIDAEASGGSVRSDIPVTVSGEVSKSRLKGTLGSGGQRLKLRSSGGPIRIEPL
jgi:DUF4097 and DUF4098 domain-containing protein YvlB